jgi:hypothetical protein
MKKHCLGAVYGLGNRLVSSRDEKKMAYMANKIVEIVQIDDLTSFEDLP